MSASEMEKQCPGGHSLVRRHAIEITAAGKKVKHKKMLCDECKRVGFAHEFMGCAACDFDLCTMCLAGLPESPRPIHDLKKVLGDTFYTKENLKVGLEAVRGKTIGIFFWSHVCEVSDMYTEALAGFYNEFNAALGEKKFEVVAVTDVADDAAKGAAEVRQRIDAQHASWLHVGGDDEAGRKRLDAWAEGVLGYSPSGSTPQLLILDERGRLLNKNALLYIGGGLVAHGKNDWRSPLVGNICVGPYAGNSDIAQARALIVLVEKCSKVVLNNVTAALHSAAPALLEQNVICFVGPMAGPAKGVRRDAYISLGNAVESWGRGWTPRALRAWMTTNVENEKHRDTTEPDTCPLMLLVDVREDIDEDARGYYVSDATLVNEARPIHDFLGCVERGVAQRFKFDYGKHWEDLVYDATLERKDPKVQPLSGKTTTDGKNYIGGVSWDDFGIEGISGKVEIDPHFDPETAEQASDCSSEHTDPEAPSDHNALLREVQGKMASQSNNEPVWVSEPKEIPTSPAQKAPVAGFDGKDKDKEAAEEVKEEGGATASSPAAQDAKEAPAQDATPPGGYHTPPRVRFADPNVSVAELADMVTSLSAIVNTQQATIAALEERVRVLEARPVGAGVAKQGVNATPKEFGLTPEDMALFSGVDASRPSTSTGQKAATVGGFSLEGLEDLMEEDASKPARGGTAAAAPITSTTPAGFGITADDYQVFTGKKLDPRRCEDDESTDSDDSEVREYRARQAAKKGGAPAAAPPAKQKTPTAYKCEDDESTDSDDSEAREYRARMAGKKGGGGDAQPATAAKQKTPAAYKCEDDDDTDSDDSEAREYRARMAAKKGGAAKPVAAAKPAAAAAPPLSPQDKMKQKREAEEKLIQEAAAIPDEDWSCGKCREFNWADATACVHCSTGR